MNDYSKLLKALRVEPFEVESVGLAKLMNDAADAIEELSAIAKEWEDAKARASELIASVCRDSEHAWIPAALKMEEDAE